MLEMKPVQEAVHDGREDDAGNGDHGESAVQRIEAGEQLSAGRAHGIDRAHATQ